MINNILKTHPIFIAEISCNHNGSLKNAKKLILEAKKSGADFVKFQTYTPSSMTINSLKKDFKIKRGIWRGKNLWQLYQLAQTPFEWQKDLFDFARKNKMKCFSTPFDETAVDVLEKLDCPIYKVSSFEINHLPLIEKIAKLKKPMIISTGTAQLNEIDDAFFTAQKNGCSDITILYCVSNYPAKPEDFNLNNIAFLKRRFKCKIGLSDHSVGNEISKLAVMAGAELIEKHIKLPNQKTGFDLKFSSTAKEIKNLISELKKIYSILGKKSFIRKHSEKNAYQLKRSIYCIKNIKKGDKFSPQNIKIIRPGFSLSPKYYKKILNKKSPYNIYHGQRLKKDLIKILKVEI